jgi:hypothetical protein
MPVTADSSGIILRSLLSAFNRVFSIEDPAVLLADKLLKTIAAAQSDAYGPLSLHRVHERGLSAFIASLLQKHWSDVQRCDQELLWCHQAESAAGSPDIGLFANLRDSKRLEAGPGMLPLSTIEMVKEMTPAKKRAQLLSYGVNNAHLLPVKCTPLSTALCISYSAESPSSTALCELHVLVPSDKTRQLADFLIFTGPCKQNSLAAILTFIAEVGALFLHQVHASPVVPAKVIPGLNVHIPSDRSRVYKSFDYREHPGIERRRTTSNLKYLPDAKVEINWDDFEILSYCYLDGSHLPNSIAQFLAVFLFVARMHKAGYVHGDLLLRNLIFAPVASRSQPIDFDWSGPVNQARYPAGFQLLVPDGGRHSSVRPMELLMPTHDWFALGEIANFFSPENDSVAPDWLQLIRVLRNGCSPLDNSELMGYLNSDVAVKLRSTKADVADFLGTVGGTGSPPRDRQKRKRSSSPD